MNYYPNNFYSGYQYPNTYQQNQFSMSPQISNFNGNSISPSYQNGLLGKIVDGEDVVKATEIPIGSFGVFPKADLNEIYIKTWNNDGTTQIVKYQPSLNTISKEDMDTSVMAKLAEIDNKINNLLGHQSVPAGVGNNPQDKRKELNMNVY